MLGREAILKRLAAIGAVPRYLRLVEADRAGTLARVTSLGRNLINPEIALQRARTLETGAVQATPITAG
jgi:hypothetical protein